MNSIFTEENLLAFTTAARFGSFSKAAEELGLTTSAISYTIKRMETGWMWCCSLAVPAALS
ncbi:LysR family transcriptional regulator [Escherichia coli]|uniref:LysR family transcriptional regulator n=1 Tax=Escherichia coli TaxID=562 RepID=A0A377F8L8_ECOLX|nr:LysR family transcriptional regulator [Escherichia coli]